MPVVSLAFPRTMSKIMSGEDFLSIFEQRRRLRRAKVIVDLTSEMIRNEPSLTYREAVSLIDCARRAVGELSPAYGSRFANRVAPVLERVVRDRWPAEEPFVNRAFELVN